MPKFLLRTQLVPYSSQPIGCRSNNNNTGRLLDWLLNIFIINILKVHGRGSLFPNISGLKGLEYCQVLHEGRDFSVFTGCQGYARTLQCCRTFPPPSNGLMRSVTPANQSFLDQIHCFHKLYLTLNVRHPYTYGTTYPDVLCGSRIQTGQKNGQMTSTKSSTKDYKNDNDHWPYRPAIFLRL